MQPRAGEATPNIRNVWWAAIFRDVQFWVPLIILVIGLLLLWIVQ